MIEQALTTLKEVYERLTTSFAYVAITLPLLESSAGSNLGVNLDASIPDTFGSIRDCNNRIQGVIGLVKDIAKLKPSSFSLVPKSLIIALPDSLSSIESQLDAMLKQIESVKSDGGLRDVGEDLIIHSVNQKSQPNVDLKTYYKVVDNQVDQALKGIHEILSIINPESFDPFSGAMANINVVQKDAQETLQELASLRRTAKVNATRAGNLITSTTAKLGTIEEQGQAALDATTAFKDTIEKHVSEAATGKGKITPLLADIEATQKKAQTLEVQVNTLKSTLDAFQSSLDA